MPTQRMKFLGTADFNIQNACGIAAVRSNEQNPYIADFTYDDPSKTSVFLFGMMTEEWEHMGEVVDGVLVPPTPPEE